MMELSLSVRNWKCYAYKASVYQQLLKLKDTGGNGITDCMVQFSHSVMSDSLQPHGLQHSRLPCPSPTPRACSNSCPSGQWCHSTLSSSVIPFLLLPSVFPCIRVFSNESVFHIRWPKYWSFSFSISPSNEYEGLVSFRVDWFKLLAIQGTLKIAWRRIKLIIFMLWHHH